MSHLKQTTLYRTSLHHGSAHAPRPPNQTSFPWTVLAIWSWTAVIPTFTKCSFCHSTGFIWHIMGPWLCDHISVDPTAVLSWSELKIDETEIELPFWLQRGRGWPCSLCRGPPASANWLEWLPMQLTLLLLGYILLWYIYFCSLNLTITFMVAGSNWASSGREPLSCAGAIFGPAHQLLHVQAAPGQRRPDEDIFRTWR